MNTRKVTVAVLCVVMSGCAANPMTAYSALESTTGVYTLLDAAVRAPSSVQLGAQQRLEISKKSPVLSDGNVKASFQHFTLVRPASSQQVTLEVQSYCDCIGLGKYVMVPRLFLVGSTGTVTELAPMRRRYESPGLIDPSSILSTWNVSPKEETSSLLLVADIRAIGGEVIQVTTQTVMPAGGVFVPITGTLQLVAYPYGKYDVRVGERQ